MFKVISDIIAHWYNMWNTIVIAFNFCNAKKMICALMFIIRKHYGIKCRSNLLQLEPCNVMLKVNSDIMALGMICEIQLLKRKWIVHW